MCAVVPICRLVGRRQLTTATHTHTQLAANNKCVLRSLRHDFVRCRAACAEAAARGRHWLNKRRLLGLMTTNIIKNAINSNLLILKLFSLIFDVVTSSNWQWRWRGGRRLRAKRSVTREKMSRTSPLITRFPLAHYLVQSPFCVSSARSLRTIVLERASRRV